MSWSNDKAEFKFAYGLYSKDRVIEIATHNAMAAVYLRFIIKCIIGVAVIAAAFVIGFLL